MAESSNQTTIPLTQQPAWRALARHHERVRDAHLRALFAQDPGRGERLALEAAGLYLDYSKNRVTDETLRLLVGLAEVIGLRERIEALFRGEQVNVTERRAAEEDDAQPSLFKDHFADFNGLDDPEKKTEFYQHSQHWSNRMILGDSLQVMASLAEREGMRGKVQCIYFDPPYGIRFNSNWQVSTQSRAVKDGKQTDISREPEQVKAFRDTWKDGIHSYLTYLRDRLTVARDLLHESGKLKEAEAAYRDALEAFGPDPLLFYNLAVLLEDLGRKAEAAETYQAALQGDPGMADCHYNLALLCEQLRRPHEAIRHMAQYRRLVAEK